MNNREKEATRDRYGAALIELASKDRNIVAMDCDLGRSTRSYRIAEVDPDRFIEMGIAELFCRRKRDRDVRGSAVPAVVAVVVALGILSFLFWGIGVYSFYTFQEGYKAIFGFGVGV